jgi:hypothetical protein
MSDPIRFAAIAGLAMPPMAGQRFAPMQPGVDSTDTTGSLSRNALALSPMGRAAANQPLIRTAPSNALVGLGLAGPTRPKPAPLWQPASLQPWQPSTQPAALPNWPAWSRPGVGIQPGGLGGIRATARPSATQQLSGLPNRAAGSASGSQFIARTQGLSRPQREQAILQEISNGNIPSHLREYKPVQTTFTDKSGQSHTGTFYVLPDYLAVGNDKDFVRMPMSPQTAQAIADKTGAVLPTRKMVDAIYEQASVQLKPSPQQASPQMMSNDYYIRHQQMIEAQRAGQPLTALTAGHKKDVVLSNRLVQHPDKVAIYGWHQPNGKAIQPLSTVHENSYADYSHGIRLVAPYMKVDGKLVKTADVMQSRSLSGLVSDEGPLQLTRIPR